jgi:hypothetical protein
MAKHVVMNGPVDHDGARYLDGEELSLTTEEAATLAALGVVQLVAAVQQKAKPEPRD